MHISLPLRRRVKFGAFLEHLEAEHPGDFDRVASGHYAAVRCSASPVWVSVLDCLLVSWMGARFCTPASLGMRGSALPMGMLCEAERAAANEF